jgi:hypothetical protein
MTGAGVRTRMATPEPKTSTFRTIVQQWAVDGVGIVIAVLFFAIVIIIVTFAVASSKSPWDTVIAALAMTSQAFFAYMVYRLGREQYAFSQDVAHRQDGFARQSADLQYKIDMYPLRRDAFANLEKAARVLTLHPDISDDQVEAVRASHLEIKRLFSDEAEALAFEVYQLVETAQRQAVMAQPTLDEGGSIIEPVGAAEMSAIHEKLDKAVGYFTDLQNIMEEEMKVR